MHLRHRQQTPPPADQRPQRTGQGGRTDLYVDALRNLFDLETAAQSLETEELGNWKNEPELTGIFRIIRIDPRTSTHLALSTPDMILLNSTTYLPLYRDYRRKEF